MNTVSLLYLKLAWAGISYSDYMESKEKYMKEDQICHRKACNNGDATYFNRSTREYYCASCAWDIQTYENTQDEPFCIFDEFYIPKRSRNE